MHPPRGPVFPRASPGLARTAGGQVAALFLSLKSLSHQAASRLGSYTPYLPICQSLAKGIAQWVGREGLQPRHFCQRQLVSAKGNPLGKGAAFMVCTHSGWGAWRTADYGGASRDEREHAEWLLFG